MTTIPLEVEKIYIYNIQRERVFVYGNFDYFLFLKLEDFPIMHFH